MVKDVCVGCVILSLRVAGRKLVRERQVWCASGIGVKVSLGSQVVCTGAEQAGLYSCCDVHPGGPRHHSLSLSLSLSRSPQHLGHLGQMCLLCQAPSIAIKRIWPFTCRGLAWRHRFFRSFSWFRPCDGGWTLAEVQVMTNGEWGSAGETRSAR